MNSVILIGNVVKEPEITTINQIKKAKVRIAVKRDYKNSNGEYESDFINIIVWRKLAEIVEKYVNKGRTIAVKGSVRVRTYKDEKDNFHEVVEIEASDIELLGKPSNNNKEEKIEKTKEDIPNEEKKLIMQIDEDNTLPF